ncbi:MAG: hypothetical protein MUC87_10865 [Bacteroidia bacterium]|jgi:hypothetical protein|nr:hypothetical protein [Bacteroidia bacterium]
MIPAERHLAAFLRKKRFAEPVDLVIDGQLPQGLLAVTPEAADFSLEYLLFVCKTERLKGLEQIVTGLIRSSTVAEKLQFAYGGYEFMVPLAADEVNECENRFYRKLSFPVEIWQYRKLYTGQSHTGEPMYRQVFVKCRKLISYYQCERQAAEYAAVS